MDRAKFYLISLVLIALIQGGCMFRQAGINRAMEQQLADDRSDAANAQQGYNASVEASGRESGQTKTATRNMNSAQRKLEADQRQFDNFKSASGQSADPRE